MGYCKNGVFTIVKIFDVAFVFKDGIIQLHAPHPLNF